MTQNLQQSNASLDDTNFNGYFSRTIIRYLGLYNFVPVSPLPGCVDDVSSAECVVDSLVVLVIGPPVHTTKYLLPKEMLLNSLNNT